MFDYDEYFKRQELRERSHELACQLYLWVEPITAGNAALGKPQIVIPPNH